MKHLLASLIVGLIVVLGGGCSRPSEPQQEEKAPVRPVRYIVLEAQTRDQSLTFSGTAEAAKESVLSFKVPGTVKAIPVKVGDRVGADTVLAELDKTDLVVELESAQAALKTSQADAKSAQTAVYTTRSNYKRTENLYENGNVSLSEFERARGDYESAEAQLQAAESRIKTAIAKLTAARNQLQYTRLAAPFDGIVNRIAVEENEEIASGTAIVTLSVPGDLQVKVGVSDLHIARIRKGMACRVAFPALPGAGFEGTVAEVPYAASDTPTYPVTIHIRSKDRRLRPGMAAQVRFFFGTAGGNAGLYVPADGVGEERGAHFVFVVEPGAEGQGTVRRREVVIGELTEAGFRVAKGLSAGERVATAGLQLLVDGMAVKLLDDPVKEW